MDLHEKAAVAQLVHHSSVRPQRSAGIFGVRTAVSFTTSQTGGAMRLAFV